MHQYRIEIFENNEQNGVAATAPTITRYADDHEAARMICEEFAGQIWESNGWKRYTVKLSVLCYKNVNRADFFAQFQA